MWSERVSSVGPFVISQRFIVFTYKGATFETWVKMIADQPKNVDRVLVSLHEDLGVRIEFEWYEFQGQPPATVNPVGSAWPQKSEELGTVVHHVVGGLDIYEGQRWEDSRGIFVARKKWGWFAPYWYWERERI